MSSRSKQDFPDELHQSSKDEKKKKGSDKSVEKIERISSRRQPTPPEEKMKRGRGLIVFLFLMTVLLSYIFSLLRDLR